MSNELVAAIQQVAEEKGLTVDSIKDTIELALAAAYRKDFGNKMQNIKVDFDLESGASKVFDVKTVVEDALAEEYIKEQEEKAARAEAGITEEPEVKPQAKSETKDSASSETEEEEEIKFNPKTMISFSEAKEIKSDIKLEAELVQELEVPSEYGRMAAQTAKQVIIQKIREAERENIYEIFKEKEHELINGMIQRVEPKIVLVDIDKTTAVLPAKEQVESERYQIGSRMKFYIKEVSQTPKGPEIVLSRNHAEILRKLFTIEVPEISGGSVVIKSISREAGSRSKIAVASKEEGIDPIGACVGQRGSRVQTIINELGGEKIDIIEFSEDIPEFISNALSPAKVVRVELDETEKTAKVYVREDQLSLAIGKGGQNVRLAAKLTGWRLDIVEETSGEVKTSSDEEVPADVQPDESPVEETSEATEQAGTENPTTEEELANDTENEETEAAKPKTKVSPDSETEPEKA